MSGLRSARPPTTRSRSDAGMDFEVLRTKERVSGAIVHGVADTEEDLVHRDAGHTGELENAIIEEITQMEPGDLIMIRAVQE